jgi:DNA-directed RNA polymerase subunit RPC12/RpoP
MKRLFYRCLTCGAVCRDLIWAALEVGTAEERCPGCGKWSKFEAVDERGNAVLMFGDRRVA